MEHYTALQRTDATHCTGQWSPPGLYGGNVRDLLLMAREVSRGLSCSGLLSSVLLTALDTLLNIDVD